MLQRLLPFLSLIVLFVALAIASPHFLTSTNLSSVVRQTAVINIMALGMTMIIITGGIDLSVGAILAMGGLLGTMAMEKGASIPVGVLVGMLTGLVCGLANGVMTTQLADRAVHRDAGHAGHLSRRDADHLERPAGAPDPAQFSFLGEGNLLGVPFVLWILVACALVTHVILEHTRLGRYAFAIGSNRGGGGLRRHSGGVPHHGGVRHRRHADGPGGDDRSVAPDDRASRPPGKATSCRPSRRW